MARPDPPPLEHGKGVCLCVLCRPPDTRWSVPWTG
jgi:hypothetical protein